MTVNFTACWTGGTCRLVAQPPNVIARILRAAIQTLLLPAPR